MEKKYSVQVRRLYADYQIVEVMAESEKKAFATAKKYAEDNPDKFCDGDIIRFSMRVTRVQV